MLTREALCAWPALVAAYTDARRGKRHDGPAARWYRDWEARLLALRERLMEGYRFGPYRTFAVRDPKRRLVAAAPFEDRVVHHAMVSLLAPPLERRMIPTSFACRSGLGGRAARVALLKQCRRGRAVRFAKCDVRRYFASVRHDVLRAQVARVCGDPWAAALVAALLDSWHSADSPGRGLPIGNLTSQLFANVYLSDVDHFMTRTVQARGYMRYVDDMLWFGEDAGGLHGQVAQLTERLATLGLTLHPRKTRVGVVAAGVDFAGAVATARTVRLRGASKRRALHHLAALRRRWRRSRSADDERLYLGRLRALVALGREVGAARWLARRWALAVGSPSAWRTPEPQRSVVATGATARRPGSSP